jgi:ribose transport system ATP-binding protein
LHDRLKLTAITKNYGATKAVAFGAEESLTFSSGEIHAVAGENGAGKSTLMKILSGIVGATSGSMELDGVPFAPSSVSDARALGVEIVLQEPGLIPTMTVAENLFLGREDHYSSFGVLDPFRQRKAAADALAFVGLAINPSVRVSDLDLETQKLVELARAMAFKPRVLIIDEMTASLGKAGVNRLYALLKQCAALGVAVLYISHYLEELFSLCDRITVMKDGRLVQTMASTDLTEPELQTMMVGRSLVGTLYHTELREDAREQVLVDIRDLRVGSKVRGVSLAIRSGEIVGVGGLVGCGNEQLAEAVFGSLARDSGSVTYRGRPSERASQRKSIRMGIGFVTGDREKNDLILQHSIQDNVSLPNVPFRGVLGVLSRRRDKSDVAALIDRLKVVCRGPQDMPGNLSGGNRQKVVLAKWLMRDYGLLILQNPTRGVDVGAKSDIYAVIRSLASRGVGVLLVSDELNELIGMSDSILMMRDGEISGAVDRESGPTEELLVGMMH